MVVIKRLERPAPPLPAAPDPYKLTEISVAGVRYAARPFEFDTDAAGSLKPTKFISQCPHCAQTIEFAASTTDYVDGTYHVGCGACGKGVTEEDILINPFCDPIGKIVHEAEFLADPLHDFPEAESKATTVDDKLAFKGMKMQSQEAELSLEKRTVVSNPAKLDLDE